MTTTLRSRAPLSFRRESDWAAWLARNHGKATEVWVKIAKKKSGEKTVNHDEAVEVALCWGWIDGQGRGLDESWWLQRFTPRTRRSPWSRINRERALALIKTGRMKKPGLAEVERAKQDGRWQKAYAGQRQSTVPDDLAAALAANKHAAAFFKTLDSKNRYAVLYRTQSAKKAETRARRIATFVGMLARGEKIHP